MPAGHPTLFTALSKVPGPAGAVPGFARTGGRPPSRSLALQDQGGTGACGVALTHPMMLDTRSRGSGITGHWSLVGSSPPSSTPISSGMPSQNAPSHSCRRLQPGPSNHERCLSLVWSSREGTSAVTRVGREEAAAAPSAGAAAAGAATIDPLPAGSGAHLLGGQKPRLMTAQFCSKSALPSSPSPSGSGSCFGNSGAWLILSRWGASEGDASSISVPGNSASELCEAATCAGCLRGERRKSMF